jgi:hypothetical protein
MDAANYDAEQEDTSITTAGAPPPPYDLLGVYDEYHDKYYHEDEDLSADKYYDAE